MSERSRKRIIRIGETFGVIVLTGVCCMLLLFFSGLIPQSAIKEGCVESAKYFNEHDLFPYLIENQFNTRQDNYSDCILANIMYHISGEEVVKSTVKASYYQPELENVNTGLWESLQEDKEPNVDYSRYWHGTLAFLRPLFTITNIQGARIVFSTIWIALMLLNILLLWKQKAKTLAVCYFAANIAMQAWVCATCIQYSTMFFMMNAVLTAVICFFHKRKDTEALYRKIGLLMAVSGVCTCFFDFLTAETLPLTVPLIILWILRYEAGELTEWKNELKYLISCVSIWGTGYALMFVFKWILVVAFSGREALLLALSSAGERFVGKVHMGNTSLDPLATSSQRFFGAIFRNQGMLFPYKSDMSDAAGFASFFAVFFICAFCIYMFRGKNYSGKMLGLCALLSAIPYIRFIVLQNHAFMHYFFTYRAQMVTVIALLYCTWEFGLGNILGKKKQGAKRRR